jgi:ATP-dependent RNA helicase RhlE
VLKQDIAIENIAGYEPSQPLRLEANTPAPGRSRNPNHARRPHPQAPNKGHVAAKKQPRQWRDVRGARKA